MIVYYGSLRKHVALATISPLAYAFTTFAFGSFDTVEGQHQDDGEDDGEF
jgi:hypothetical protein